GCCDWWGVVITSITQNDQGSQTRAVLPRSAVLASEPSNALGSMPRATPEESSTTFQNHFLRYNGAAITQKALCGPRIAAQKTAAPGDRGGLERLCLLPYRSRTNSRENRKSLRAR